MIFLSEKQVKIYSTENK